MKTKSDKLVMIATKWMPSILALIMIESALAGTYVVNTTEDVLDGSCDGIHCSLRDAVEEANLNPGRDVIKFNIRRSDPNWNEDTCAIALDGEPIGVTDAVTINGNGKIILISGPSNDIAIGFSGNSGPTDVKGMVFAGGITIENLQNMVFEDNILNNGGRGIGMSNVENIQIVRNLISTNDDNITISSLFGASNKDVSIADNELTVLVNGNASANVEIPFLAFGGMVSEAADIEIRGNYMTGGDYGVDVSNFLNFGSVAMNGLRIEYNEIADKTEFGILVRRDAVFGGSTGDFTDFAIVNNEFSNIGDLPISGCDSSFCVVDSDGDGIPDGEDPCPESDFSPTVIIGQCDSGVENIVLDDGCTFLSDLIDACADRASSHGAFVRSVAALTNALKEDGDISGNEKGAIQKCAAKADRP